MKEFVASADVAALTYLLTQLAGSFAASLPHQRASLAYKIDRVCAALTACASKGPESGVAAAAFIHASGLNAVADVVEVRGRLPSMTPFNVMRLLIHVFDRATAPWNSPPAPQQWVRLANSLLKAEPLDWMAVVPGQIDKVFAGLSFFCHQVREMHALCEWAAARYAKPRNWQDWNGRLLDGATCNLVTNLLSASHASSRRHAWTFEGTGTLHCMVATMLRSDAERDKDAAASALRQALACFNAPTNGEAHNELCAHWVSTGFVNVLQQCRSALLKFRRCADGGVIHVRWNGGGALLDDIARCLAANVRVAEANAAAAQANAEAQRRARAEEAEAKAEEAVAEAKAAAIAAATVAATVAAMPAAALCSGMHVKAEDVDVCLAQVVAATD